MRAALKSQVDFQMSTFYDCLEFVLGEKAKKVGVTDFVNLQFAKQRGVLEHVK